jgi:sugar/nucleoside kinase (ribokinase family)
MNWDVVGLGENSVDTVIRIPGAPLADVKLRISSRQQRPGGQVATTLATCAGFGLRAAYLGAFGNDDHAQLVRDELARRGVDVSHAVVRPVPNRHAVILVDEQTGTRTVLWERDDQLNLSPVEVPREIIAASRLLHVDDVDVDASLQALRIARELGVPSTADIDLVNDHTARLIDAASMPIMAAHVPAALTGEPDSALALRRVQRPHHTLLVVTLGADGALALHGDEIVRVPPHPVTVVDTTGAGDVFRGALIYARLRGDTPADALQFANVTAAISCTQEGAMGGIPITAERLRSRDGNAGDRQ